MLCSNLIFIPGHTRQQSQMSEGSDSSTELPPGEADKKIIAQLNEVLVVREQRLVELSRENASLTESNMELSGRVAELENNSSEEAVREEFTFRLAAIEKRFQIALRDKEAAEAQLKSERLESALQSDVSVELKEKDMIITELREEGEKLSKQQLQYSTTLKKLRQAHKELEKTNAQHKVKVNLVSPEKPFCFIYRLVGVRVCTFAYSL